MTVKNLDTAVIHQTEGHRRTRTQRSKRREMLQALEDWLPTLNVRADLTLKMGIVTSAPNEPRTYQSIRIDADLIGTAVRAMNRLNRYVWKGERHSRRLSAIIYWERGGANGRPHLHALVERPSHITFELFATELKRAWCAQPFANKVMQIAPIQSLTRSLDYNTKQGFDRLVYIHKDMQNGDTQ